MVKVTITFEHSTPRAERKPTIWEALAEKLGRQPTSLEAANDVRRILSEASVERASKPARRPIRIRRDIP